MMNLAQKHSKDIDEIHKLYYQVSCDRERLSRHLNGDKSIVIWTELEDLALRDQKQGAMYQHVVSQKGESEVLVRRQFLEMV